ncbi:MAG TPA: hypothetical protein VMQ86_15165 [Bryobacteraceae bacterium]|jgi:hypothetical protein|nr:hypothetical protein [Bryobacteraceae bacterium]
MAQLFDIRCKLDQFIAERKLDKITVYGDIGLKAGFLVSLLRGNTPDDEAKLLKFRKAAQEVLHMSF